MPASSFPFSLAILIAINSVAQVSCGDQCFNIDQIQEQAYYPCDPSASTSNCCQATWVCLSNGLCEPGDNPHRNPVTWTGFCTDPLWGNTTACPKVCQNNVTAASYVDNRVSSCGDGHFCCYEDNNSSACCSTPSNWFSLGVATVVTTIPNATSAPSTIGSGTGTTSVATNTPATGNTQSATSPAMRTQTPRDKIDRHVAIGVGVGVGVPVVLAILAAGFFYRMSRHVKPSPVENGKMDDILPKPRRKGKIEELPAVDKPAELIQPGGLPWELEGPPKD